MSLRDKIKISSRYHDYNVSTTVQVSFYILLPHQSGHANSTRWLHAQLHSRENKLRGFGSILVGHENDVIHQCENMSQRDVTQRGS